MKVNIYSISAVFCCILFSGCNKLVNPVMPSGEYVLEIEDSGLYVSADTKVTAVTSLPSSLWWCATQGTAGSSETAKWSPVSGTVSSGKIATGKSMPTPAVTYNWYVSNRQMTVTSKGATISVDQSSGDVIAGIRSGSETNPSISVNHVLARTGSLTFNTQSGYTVSNVSWKISRSTSGTSGTYNISSGAWTAGSTAMVETALTSSSDLYLIPGSYTTKVTYTLSKGSYSETFTRSGSVTLAAGKVNNITATATGGSASEVTFSASVQGWVPKESHSVVPEKVLPGVFTLLSSITKISRKVRFSSGYLYWDGTGYKFEDEQYYINPEISPTHLNYFGWAQTAEEAVVHSLNYSYSNISSVKSTSKLFAAENLLRDDWDVMTADEFHYQVKGSSFSISNYGKKEAAVTAEINGIVCIIFKPDNYSGTVRETYTLDEWRIAEAEGLVAFPYSKTKTLEDGNDVSYGSSYYFTIDFLSKSVTSNTSDSGTTTYYGCILDCYKTTKTYSGFSTNSSYAYSFYGYPIRLVQEVPKPTLPGVFTVNDSGKKVRFSRGNLYWDGYNFVLEEHQYDYPTTWVSTHVGHFYYSKNANLAISRWSYSDSSASTSDVLFAADGGAIAGWTVLTKDEWQYLINHNMQSKNAVTIAGINCLVLVPDGYSGTVASSYTASAWETAEAEGLVAIPFAGSYCEGEFRSVGTGTGIWLYLPYTDTITSAYDANFYNGGAGFNHSDRNDARSIRLVKVL